MEGLKGTSVYSLLLFFVLFDFHVSGGTAYECGGNFTDVLQGIISFNSADYELDTRLECQWNIWGPAKTFVQVALREADVKIGNDSSLEMLDGNLGEIIILDNEWATETGSTNLYVNSLTNILLIIFTSLHNSHDTSFDIPFEVLFKSNSTTMYTDPWGTIASNGSTKEQVINYVHTYQIDVDNVNGRVYLTLDQLTLNYESGDFIAIGSGDDVFNESPPILLSGNRTSFSPIAVESGKAYLHLYVTNYTAGLGFSFSYNSSVFVPPTDEPPTTAAPPSPLNVTINFESSKDDLKKIVTRFVSSISTSAVRYCRGDFIHNGTISNLTYVDVYLVEAVYAVPCVVFVFYIVLLENDTCLRHTPFTVDDFYHMMGNYSSTIEKDFGRPILQSCDADVSVWVVFVAVLFCFSMTLTIVVAMTKRNDGYNKLAKNVTNDTGEVKRNPIFGVKVAADEENAYVLWSQSERPSIVTNVPLMNAGRRSRCSTNGFLNQGFVGDNYEEKKEVTFARDPSVQEDVEEEEDNDGQVAQVLYLRRMSMANQTFADGSESYTETPPQTPSIELAVDISENLKEVLKRSGETSESVETRL